jgi:hypothetical protein
VTHQASELGGALAKGRIAKRLLDHPSTEPGLKLPARLTLLALDGKSRVAEAVP